MLKYYIFIQFHFLIFSNIFNIFKIIKKLLINPSLIQLIVGHLIVGNRATKKIK